jgi:predicted NAD/FAD-dependent oxidoreductase
MTRRRVCVIGAGAAGLSAAAELVALGHAVVVLEKEDHVGGKCRSLVYNDVPYDLGANLTTPRYTALRPLAESLGLTLRELSERRIVNVSQRHFPSLTEASLFERLALRGGASLYELSRGVTGIDRVGYAGLGKGLGRPFGDWLRDHGLGRFAPVFANLFIAYGYGVMEDLPAAYALKFFDPVHMHTAIDVVLGNEVNETRTFTEGFQELWVRLVEQRGLDVRLGVAVQSVDRSPQGVEVRWDADGEVVTERFDDLVVACPLDAALAFLDASTEEQRLFSKIRYNDYFVTAAVVRDAPEVSTFVQPYAVEYTPGQPTIFYSPIPELDDDLFFFYAYGDGATTVDEVQANIRALLDGPKFQAHIERIVATHHWRYFPHVTCEDMRAGFYEDVEALQGRWNTWYVGELLSFTLVELVHRYSRDLVERHFA